jgi:glycosyltransferase involved in cell wall biosynthesis
VKIALIGTRGVPARYGGFETAVEEVGQRLAAAGHEVTVFCRNGDTSLTEYLGMKLVHLPAVKHRVAETLSHTALSTAHPQARHADVAIVFNAANAPLLPVLRAAGVPTAVHVDGLEWKRSKWSGTGKRYYQASERLAVRWADALISDAHGIQQYYREAHGAESVFIPYGAPILTDPAVHRLPELELTEGGYHLVVARFEPENNVATAIEAYTRSPSRHPLVVVGSAPYAERYTERLQELASADDRVRMLGAVWDQELLDALYAGSLTYVHGHSVGGTNPSLLRAMGAGAPVLAYDVVFNREVLEECGLFWSDADDLAELLVKAEAIPDEARERGAFGRDRASQVYTWDDVAQRYEALCLDLAQLRRPTPLPKHESLGARRSEAARTPRQRTQIAASQAG